MMTAPDQLDAVSNTAEFTPPAPKRRRLEPLSWGQLQALPKRDPLIKGILDRAALSVVYGESNSGKTFIAMDMALHIAINTPWLGRRTKSGKVLYIAAEGGLGIGERLKAFELHHKPDVIPAFFLMPYSIDLCSADADANEIAQEARLLGEVELIIVDTLARAMAGGNENNPDDMGALIRNCDLIREQTKAHVLIIHHSGKDSTRGSRGHSSLKAAVDTEIEVTQSESGTVTAKIMKQRDGRTGEAFSFILESVPLGHDDDGEPITSCAVVPTDAPPEEKQPVKGRQRMALQILHNLIAERGIKGIPKSGMKELTFVRIDDFRTALKAGNIIASDSPDNVRRGIQTVIEALNSKGLIGTWEEKAWPTG